LLIRFAIAIAAVGFLLFKKVWENHHGIDYFQNRQKMAIFEGRTRSPYEKKPNAGVLHLGQCVTVWGLLSYMENCGIKRY
jgi:hypothetical protein